MSKTRKGSKYPMRVFFDSEVKEWVAEVVDLPGCTGAGDSASEAVDVAASVIPEWIALAKERGMPVAPPTERLEASGKFVVRVSKSLHSRLQDRAAIEQTSLNQLAVQYLSEGLSRADTTDQIQARVDQVMRSGFIQGTVYEVPIGEVRKAEAFSTMYSRDQFTIRTFSYDPDSGVAEESGGLWLANIQSADAAEGSTYSGVASMAEDEEEQCQNRTN